MEVKRLIPLIALVVILAGLPVLVVSDTGSNGFKGMIAYDKIVIEGE